MPKMMPLKLIVCLLILTFPLSGIYANEKTGESVATVKEQAAEAIMRQVIEKADIYEDVIQEYGAEIYLKGRTEILKKNFLIRFANHLFPLDWKHDDQFFELVTNSRYNAPNNFVHTVKAVNANTIPNQKKQLEALTFLNINVYSQTAYDEAIFMPTAKNAFRHYRFELVRTETIDGHKAHVINFYPKQWSPKLVCGTLHVLDKSWLICKIDMNGRYSFAEFNVVLNFRDKTYHFFLPESSDIFLRYKLLGNAVVSQYHVAFKYDHIKLQEIVSAKKRRPLDLTNYFKIERDNEHLLRDSAYWAEKRDLPLTDEEIALSQVEPIDSAAIAAIDTLSNQFLKRSNEMAQRLTGSWNWDLNATRIKYSGLLNPFQLGYSHRNGITYKQEFRISKTFPCDRQLRFNPDIGFVFKRKEIFVHLNALWEYLPERRGQLSLSLGNDNQTYSSKITNQIQEILEEHQATINFDDLDLDYFHHYYAELRNSIELFNGFELDTRLTYHQRTPVRPKDNIIPPGGQLEDLAFSNYHDFVPSIGFIYTPRQYYRMDGHRKEYLYSYFPTFSLNVAKAIPGVLGSTGNYCRVEADMHQSINLGLSRRLNYHLSGGFYAQQKSTYFAEFYYFTRRNFPESWNDQIGGVFNLLSGEWFNASDKYMQAHLMYESPFVLFKFLARSPKYLQVASRYIITERFYLSQLWTPALPSYTEIGYGIGNNLFNIGFFAGFDRWKYDGFGLKFAFELFQ